MLKTALYLSGIPGEQRALLLRDGRPIDLSIERMGSQPFRQSLFLAQVEQWAPALGGAFVSLGELGKAFLPAHATGAQYKPGERHIVTVTAAAHSGRPARVSTDIALPGPRIVVVPGHKGIAVSGRMRHKMTPAVELMLHHLRRADLKGIVLRESALAAAPEAVVAEATALSELWALLQEHAQTMAAPGPITMPDGMPLGQHTWMVADALSQGRVAVSQKETAQQLQQFWRAISSDLAERIGVQEQFVVDNHVDQALETALSRELPFGSHGNLVFEESSIVNAIDVCSFSPLKRGGRHGLNANLAAVGEVARLIRLKGLAGNIIINFLNDDDEVLPPAIEADLRKSLADDPADCEVLGVMAGTSLMHIRRERFGPRLSEIYFDGVRPQVLSFESVSVQLFRTLAEDVAQSPNASFTVCAHPNYIAWLNARDKWRALLPITAPDKLRWRPDPLRDEREPCVLSGAVPEAALARTQKQPQPEKALV